jgi:hypothetical protein
MDRVPSGDQAIPDLGECVGAGSESVPPDDHVRLDRPTEPPAFLGRRDIDSAMVAALRHAMDSDHGLAAPVWVVPLPEQFGEHQHGDRCDSMPEPRELSGRCDIDSAMVAALRHAMVSDRASPRA